MSAGVRPGYKQTEVGVIPEEWEVRQLRECCAKVTDGTHDTPKPVRSGIPFLTAIHVKDNWIDFENCLFLPENIHKIIYRRCNPEKNDVLFVNIGAGVATSALIKEDFEFSLKNVALLKPLKSYLLGSFLNYCLAKQKPNIIQAFLSGGAQPFLGLNQIASIKIPLPPLPEQRAIAQTLGDVDALLASLTQLIAKKRDLKQAAMQQLLTGETRLPGFSGEWEVKRLVEVSDCLDNLRVPLNENQRNRMRGDYPYCGANGVLDYVNDYVVEDDIILMAEDGGYFDEYASRPIAYRMVGKCWVNNHAHILKAKAGYGQEFLFYSLVHKNILKYLASGTRAKLNRSEMNKIEMNLPPSKQEQAAIAAALSDMDTEIATLEARLEKTRALKQGMMQELLTGKTRLL